MAIGDHRFQSNDWHIQLVLTLHGDTEPEYLNWEVAGKSECVLYTLGLPKGLTPPPRSWGDGGRGHLT